MLQIIRNTTILICQKRSLMNKKEVYIKLIYCLKIYFMTWAFTKIAYMGVRNILSLVFLVLSVLLVNSAKASKEHKGTYKKGAVVLGIVFAALYSLVDYVNWVYDLSNMFFRVVIIGAVFLGLALIFYYVVLLIFNYLDKVSLHNNDSEILKGNAFLSTFLLCVICYLPYFLYLFPGVMTPDSINQLEQAIGLQPYSNHHPWVHTLIIKLCFNIGNAITGDPEVGIAFYSVFQMIMGSLTASYVVSTLKQLKVKKYILIFAALFYALVPYNAVFAVTMWKDVLFSYAVMIFICATLRDMLLLNSADKGKGAQVVNCIVLMISSLGFCLLRSNGYYAFIITCVVYIAVVIRRLSGMRRLNIAIMLFALFASAIIKGPVMKACAVTQPDFVESLSIPLQQAANVIIKENNIDDRDNELIVNVIDTTYIADLYEPTFADNIKELVRAGQPEVLEGNKRDYLGLYIRLGLKYPYDYLDAYRGQTSGYWYPDSALNVADTEGIIDNECGVYSYPLLRGKFVIKLKEISLKLGDMLPFYSILFSVGAVFWLLLIGFTYSVINKNVCYVSYVPIIALVLTVLIATPVSGNFRYVYFMILFIPLLIGTLKYEESMPS